MAEGVLVTVTHLAKRALEDSARASLVAESNGDGTYSVLLSQGLAEALTAAADAEGVSVSDYILAQWTRRPTP